MSLSCLCCKKGLPVQDRRVCPECGHIFQGNGWDGIDAHWRAKECGVSDAERAEIVDFIAANPTAGDEISGTGGARKVRFARRGQGKSGGYRVITFYRGVDIPVFLITMFAKNEKSNISQAEKNAMRKGLKALAEHYRGKEDDKGR